MITKSEIKKITEVLRIFYINCSPFQKPLMKNIIISLSVSLFKNNEKKQDSFRKECGYIK